MGVRNLDLCTTWHTLQPVILRTLLKFSLGLHLIQSGDVDACIIWSVIHVKCLTGWSVFNAQLFKLLSYLSTLYMKGNVFYV